MTDTSCARCGQDHARCTAHNRAGGPCGHWPATNQTVCRRHGGASPQALAAAEARAGAAVAAADAKRVLAHEGRPTDLDVLEEFQRLGHEVIAFKDALAERVNAITQIRYSADGAGTEQLRSEVVLYERALDRVERFLKTYSGFGFEERRIEIAERDGRLIAGALTRILSRLNLTDEQQGRAPAIVTEELRAITAITSAAAPEETR